MPPKHLELVARASLHGLGYCDVVSDTTISDLHAPTEPACLRRSGHSCVGDASSLPSSADSPQAPHVPDRRSLPAPTPNGFPLQPPRAISPSLEKTPLSLADSSETALPPASLHLNPRCSSCSTGPQDRRPPSSDPGSDVLRFALRLVIRQLASSPHLIASLAARPDLS